MKRPTEKQNAWADHYTHRAQKENFAARSVYKLQEIQKKYRIIKRAARILDLGCAPGSWLQFSARETGPAGQLVGIDLTPVVIDLPDNATVISGDAALLEDHLAKLGQTG
ncbi:MAG: RlmE family RNA methyltransferase, partial [Desulfosarcina sp.]